jgi:hypothetical protein
VAFTPTVRTAKLFRSIDKGKTWQEYKSGIPPFDGWLFFSAAFRDSKNGLIVGANANTNVGTPYVGMLQTVNGGELWDFIPADLPTYFRTYQRPQLTYIPKTKNTYMLSGVTTGAATSYTKDGGLTWAVAPTIPIPMTVGPNLPTKTFFSSPSVGWRGIAYLRRAGALYKWSGGTILSLSKDISDNISLHISPNPSSGMVNIEWKSTDYTPPKYLKVTDAMGRVVFEKRNLDRGIAAQTIDLQGVANGLYFIEIQTEGGRGIKKLMIQH